MFVRNDASPAKRYFNGKIGRITRISDADIGIQCPDDESEIEVEPAVWENIEYTIDPETSEIIANKIGSFKQFPLKLAWAITIHKSQGLTFDRAIIDARAAFTHGQVYVALSRCKTFEGMVLSSPLSAVTVRTDATVLRFAEQASRNPPSAEKLAAAKSRLPAAACCSSASVFRICALDSVVCSPFSSKTGAAYRYRVVAIWTGWKRPAGRKSFRSARDSRRSCRDSLQPHALPESDSRHP